MAATPYPDVPQYNLLVSSPDSAGQAATVQVTQAGVATDLNAPAQGDPPPFWHVAPRPGTWRPELTDQTPPQTGCAPLLVQQRLQVLGYAPGALDGVYGPTTAAAVSAFQAASNLPATGVVDAATWQALELP